MKPDEWDSALLRAHEALEVGDAEQASFLAHAVLEGAGRHGSRLFEGRALACLAHCDRQLSRLRSAHDASQRAVQILREAKDLAGEVMALTTLSHTATSLGWVDEAVENALLAVALAERLPASHLQALTQNYLGTAFFWSRDYEHAAAAFERSADLAKQMEPAASPLQPLLNLVFLEVFRHAMERYDGHLAPSPCAVERQLHRCDEVMARLGDESLMLGMTVTARTLWHIFRGLAATWAGKYEEADAELIWSEAWEGRYGQVTWLTGMRRWLQLEVAWAQGRLGPALAFGAQLVAVATQAEHEELARLGHVALAHLHRTRGDRAAEAHELLALRQREQRIRAEALRSRAQAVQWQLQARASADQIVQLESKSRLHEQLALEDSLTGIPNRRAFDRTVLASEGATSAEETTCIALIDVDSFKKVNDAHSHHVGDQVLKVVADIVSRSVRGQDFVARLAGDEFVALFKGAQLTDAKHICERMKAAVREHDWEAISPGLRVTISVGVEQAAAGESVHALLQRSDKRMYEDKALRASA